MFNRKIFARCSGTRICAVIGGLATMAVANEAAAQELSYRLPQTTMVAGWQARITRCPSPGDPEFGYTANAVVAGIAGPGELVRLNPRSPFLGSRSVALTFHDNGTLKTINAEGEGQGGAVIGSLLKSAAGFFALGVPLSPMPVMALPGPHPRPRPNIACKSEIEQAVSRWLNVREAIDLIEADLAAGRPLGAARASRYEELKEEQAELEEELTLSTSVKLTRTRPQALVRPGSNAGYSEIHPLDPIDIGEWLEADAGHPLPALKIGQFGFCARFSATQDAFAASSPVETLGIRQWRRNHVSAAGTLNRSERLDRFVYLAPVPVSVELWTRASPGADCTAAAGRDKKLTAKTVLVPQLSDYFILPLGSGAFESKSTSAEFTADGHLVGIGASGTGAGAQLAEALAGGLVAAETVRDAPTNGIQRRIDRIKAENELGLLLEPSETSTVSEPS